MSDPEGLVSFEAGGAKYTAVFGFRAMKETEVHYDKPFFVAIAAAMPDIVAADMNDAEKVAAAARNIRISDIGTLFRFALVKHHSDLTEADVEDLIDEIGLDAVGGILNRALSAALVKEDDVSSDRNPRPRKSRTG